MQMRRIDQFPFRWFATSLFCVAVAMISGCATAPVPPPGFVERTLRTDVFPILVWEKLSDSNAYIRAYIEGDGHAFNAFGRPSSDPTPKDTLVRRMAFGDPHPNVIYLARPCQFNTKVPACTKEVWTTARFSQAVIDAEVDALKELAGNRETVLIGFSGGAQVAGLMSVLDKDLKVRKLVTVAGNLDHEAWCRQHKMSMLDGSLSLADFREEYISIPQAHFVGENDAVVNPFLTREFIKDPGRIREVKGASHAKGWDAAFPAIWEEN